MYSKLLKLSFVIYMHLQPSPTPTLSADLCNSTTCNFMLNITQVTKTEKVASNNKNGLYLNVVVDVRI